MENLTTHDLALLIGSLQLQLLDAQAHVARLKAENEDLKAQLPQKTDDASN